MLKLLLMVMLICKDQAMLQVMPLLMVTLMEVLMVLMDKMETILLRDNKMQVFYSKVMMMMKLNSTKVQIIHIDIKMNTLTMVSQALLPSKLPRLIQINHTDTCT